MSMKLKALADALLGETTDVTEYYYILLVN